MVHGKAVLLVALRVAPSDTPPKHNMSMHVDRRISWDKETLSVQSISTTPVIHKRVVSYYGQNRKLKVMIYLKPSASVSVYMLGLNDESLAIPLR